MHDRIEYDDNLFISSYHCVFIIITYSRYMYVKKRKRKKGSILLYELIQKKLQFFNELTKKQ